METVLTLSGVDFPPTSARGCKQTLTLVENGRMLRTINGDLHFVGGGPSKYHSVIECQDKIAPSLNKVTRGSLLTVGCIQRLSQTLPKGETEVILEREAIPDSILAMTKDRETIGGLMVIDGRHVGLPSPQDQDIFISYRPHLKMRVKRLSLQTDEWGLGVGWQLEVEEV
ncbi:MAG: hypothetical protein ACK5O7_02685 [Holosporales bacterium]